MNFIMDGGPVFMVPLLGLLILIIVLFFKGLKDNSEKIDKLISSISLFAFVFGLLGFVVGLISALEIISSGQQNISSQMLAGGLKVGLISPAFGMVIFLVGKLLNLILVSKKK